MVRGASGDEWRNSFGGKSTISLRMQCWKSQTKRPLNLFNPSYYQIFFLIAFLEEAFIRNLIIILCINYNNAVINNNYWRVQFLILRFRISMRTWKNLFEIYRQFWHALSKKVRQPLYTPLIHDFSSPVTGITVKNPKVSILSRKKYTFVAYGGFSVIIPRKHYAGLTRNLRGAHPHSPLHY